MSKNKKGYTIVEIMLCLGISAVLLLGVHTLYQKTNHKFFEYTGKTNQMVEKNSAFLTLNDTFLSATSVSLSGNTVYVDNHVLAAENNKLFLDDQLLIEDKNGIRIESSVYGVIIYIGGEEWCFSGLNEISEGT